VFMASGIGKGAASTGTTHSFHRPTLHSSELAVRRLSSYSRALAAHRGRWGGLRLSVLSWLLKQLRRCGEAAVMALRLSSQPLLRPTKTSEKAVSLRVLCKIVQGFCSPRRCVPASCELRLHAARSVAKFLLRCFGVDVPAGRAESLFNSQVLIVGVSLLAGCALCLPSTAQLDRRFSFASL
jgi:hypothetical protein